MTKIFRNIVLFIGSITLLFGSILLIISRIDNENNIFITVLGILMLIQGAVVATLYTITNEWSTKVDDIIQVKQELYQKKKSLEKVLHVIGVEEAHKRIKKYKSKPTRTPKQRKRR